MTSSTLRLVAAVLAGLVLVAVGSTVAFAHVELESSSPPDGVILSAPPESIDLSFSTAAEPAGPGVALIDATGAEIPIAVEQSDETMLIVTPIDLLESGDYVVTWTMKAGDAHPKSGSFAFGVDTVVPSPGASGASSPGQGQIQQESTTVAVPVVVAEPNTAPGEWLSRIGRWGAMLGALVGIGAFAFAATSLVGTRREVEESGYWIRRAGLLIIVGTLVEIVGASMLTAGSFLGGFAPRSVLDVLSGAFGLAILLRLLGGAAMLQGAAVTTSAATVPVADPVVFLGSNLEPAMGDTMTLAPAGGHTTYRLDIQHSGAALLGVALIVLSYLFDGHTVTAAPAPIVRVANVAHVLAAGVWLGGVLLMGATLTSRRRRKVALDAAPMAVRFSRVAGVSVLLVGVAGLALAWSILDSPSELVTTPWGRLLIAKVAAVCVAAGMGAYNHLKVVPVLEANPGDEQSSNRLREVVRVEGATLLAVVAITAVFVGVAS